VIASTNSQSALISRGGVETVLGMLGASILALDWLMPPSSAKTRAALMRSGAAKTELPMHNTNQ